MLHDHELAVGGDIVGGLPAPRRWAGSVAVADIPTGEGPREPLHPLTVAEATVSDRRSDTVGDPRVHRREVAVCVRCRERDRSQLLDRPLEHEPTLLRASDGLRPPMRGSTST